MKRVLLLVMIPAFMWGVSVTSDPDYYLDVKFFTNENAFKEPFSWRKGDAMVVITFKNDKVSSSESVIKNVCYYK